ncbi:MAG: DUF1501 domain-containing protein [Pseudomonadota bacterium]
MTHFNRRQALGLFGAATFATTMPVAFAEGMADRKFVFVLARGAMDGLSALVPADASLERFRPGLIASAPQSLPLGNGFSLHPALSTLKSWFDAGDAAFVHAAASPYRGRSHFDGQDVVEILGAADSRDGWLNRVLGVSGQAGLAIGYSIPLALRGRAPATNWAPAVFEAADDDLMSRLETLYANDPVFSEPLDLARTMGTPDVDMGRRGGGPGRAYTQSIKAVGELMARSGGPGVAMVSLDGWDSHAGQTGFLNGRFQGLDAGFAALKDALGAHWENTCVVLCSEFGRTVAENGTRGTDHGTGGLVILAGGAVRGGKVLGDWPGVSQRALYEGRDLAPANDLTSILKGLLRDHLGIDRGALDSRVFQNSSRPMDGLIV